MFINKIGYWADIRGVKHKHLAKECGVSIQTFSRWVNNHTQPDLKQGYIISRILNIKLDELVKVEDELDK
ncbi:helix-turn-helix transcriptional regulator [Peribacillus loiseleuriae]|uniref:helix-turn-helix transcriptional regulator n=1 Tax=Peribacillus loiseleuriae TaxID=1679170 RepID=UPI003821733F